MFYLRDLGQITINDTFFISFLWLIDVVWHSVLYWAVVQTFSKMHSMQLSKCSTNQWKGLQITHPALLLAPITGSVAM